MAFSYEKAEGIVDELIKKGKIALQEGKELNEELKRKAYKFMSPDSPPASEQIKDVILGMNLATKQDIDDLKKKIGELGNQH
jgi:polyhydroxyalkanoate synthesis regulator phasin